MGEMRDKYGRSGAMKAPKKKSKLGKLAAPKAGSKKVKMKKGKYL